MTVLIIAEIGVNHNANWELAVNMIREAAKSGADVIKFQTAIPELVQTMNAPMAKYQVENTGREETQLEMSRNLHFPLEYFPLLKTEVEKYNKIFMSTAFDLKSLEFLSSMGAQDYKVPSGEITNLPYLRAIGSKANKVFLSTGMASWDEVREAVSVLIDCGLHNKQITVLQCNTQYPTPFEDVNLKAMRWMGEKLNVNYGYSDHTLGIEAAIAAVALGATVIEKHFTTDNDLIGPDHKASLNPEEFKAMVASIRNIEKALGVFEKKVSPSELENKIIARRSIYTAEHMCKGDVLRECDLIVLRPEMGMSPMQIDKLTGKRLLRDLPAQHPISLNDVE